MTYLLVLLLSGCSVMYIDKGQPALQSISFGQPVCVFSCENAQTATKGEGGNVTGATISQAEIDVKKPAK